MTLLSILTLLRKVGGALTRVPGFVWATLLTLGMLYGGWWLHLRSIELAVQRDRDQRSAAAVAFVNAFYAGEREKARWAVASAEERTRAAWAARDSAVRRTQLLERQLAASRREAQTAIGALPDSIRTLPGVVRVIAACTELANDCEQLRVAVDVERASADSARAKGERERSAREAERLQDSTALHKSGEIVAAERDTAATERKARQKAEKRPTWTRVGGIVVAVGVTTWQITKAIVKRGNQ